jgi:hypothetical protein
MTHRTRWHWHLGVTVWIGLCYFPPQIWPLKAASTPPALSWESAVPFMPWWAVIYQSLFLLHCAAFRMGEDMAAIRRYGFSVALAFAAGAPIFWFWPTSIDRPPCENVAIQWLISCFDGPRNALPSLHAAMSILLVHRFWSASSTMIRAALTLWLPVLLFSTLATKQHRVVDLFFGLLLGLVAAWCQQAVVGWLASKQRTPVVAGPELSLPPPEQSA